MTPEQCPAASSHGNPFRYCGSCSWVEPPLPETVRLTEEERARFVFHPATPTTGPRHDAVRAAAAAYAAALAAVVPGGRHRALVGRRAEVIGVGPGRIDLDLEARGLAAQQFRQHRLGSR